MNQQKVGNVYQNPMKNYRRFAEQHLFEIKKNSDLSSMDMMNLLIDTKHCDNWYVLYMCKIIRNNQFTQNIFLQNLSEQLLNNWRWQAFSDSEVVC